MIHLENKKPENNGNASIINEICNPIFQLAIARYEAIFDYYSEEPHTIYIQPEISSNIIKYDQILRIRKWIPNIKSYSWSIYSQDNDLKFYKTETDFAAPYSENLILRYVEWDNSADIEFVRNHSKDSIKNNEQAKGCREDLLNKWPCIITTNVFLSEENSKHLSFSILEFDKTINNNLLLNDRIEPNWEWRDLELKRHFNWGQIHMTWSQCKENVSLETFIANIESMFEILIRADNPMIHKIALDYSIIPEQYKKIITGEK